MKIDWGTAGIEGRREEDRSEIRRRKVGLGEFER
jgi:hypothetical protein